MATVTETDLQQVKDLIISLHSETQQQIADLALNTHQQIADSNTRLNLGLAEVKEEIKELKAELKSVDIQINDYLRLLLPQISPVSKLPVIDHQQRLQSGQKPQLFSQIPKTRSVALLSLVLPSSR
jgi:uncharacterized protein YPO0396